jgi:hypothetical protein
MPRSFHPRGNWFPKRHRIESFYMKKVTRRVLPMGLGFSRQEVCATPCLEILVWRRYFFGVASGLAVGQAFTRFAALIVPIPVAKSQPVVVP